MELYSNSRDFFIMSKELLKNDSDALDIIINYMDSLSSIYKKTNNFALSNKFAIEVIDTNKNIRDKVVSLLSFSHFANKFASNLQEKNTELEMRLHLDMILIESISESIERQNILLREYLTIGE